MSSIYEYVLEVSETDIDIVGHVNNVVYVQWMQDAAIAHSAALGWTVERYQQLGAGWVARLHQIEYLQPAYAGDRVIIRTWVADMKKVSSTRKYEMIRYDKDSTKPTVLVVAHTNWVFIGFEQRVPRRIPAEIAAAFPLLDSSSAENGELGS